MEKRVLSMASAVFGILALVVFPALALLSERANAAATTNPAGESTEQLIDQLSDADPAVREHAGLVVLNLDGDSCPAVEAALARPDLPPAARPILQRALPRLRARARILAEYTKNDAWGGGETEQSQWDRFGHKDARWNGLVEKGFDLFAHNNPASRRAAHQAFEKAIATGCDDPLVLYLNARSMRDLPESNAAELAERFRAAAKAMLASDYSAPRKLLALMQYVHASKTLPPDADIDQFLKLARESAQAGVPRTVMVESFWVVSAKLTDAIGREPAFKKLYPTFQQVMPNAWEPLVFKATFEVRWAWDARGNGWANTVTPEGWKLMGERIEAARSALEQAWKIDPTHSAIAREMITVCMAQSDRDGLGKWFQRGIEANPDDYELCSKMLYALMPRWLGSHELMLEFGHQCAATQNVRAGLPSILLDAHTKIAAESPDEYFKQPIVWDETHKIFEDRIALYPTSYNRSRFAEWAARCGRWEVVAAQCEKLGSNPDRTVFPDQRKYAALRAKAKKQIAGE